MNLNTSDTLPDIPTDRPSVLLPVVLGMLLCLIGGAASALAIKVHMGSVVAGCKVGAMDCQQVLGSKYGQILGLPLPVLTGPYYLLLAICLGLYGFGKAQWRTSIARLVRLATLAALLPTLGLMLVSALVLKVFCPLCLTMDGVNFLLVGCALQLRDEFGQKVQIRLFGPWSQWAVAPAVGAFIALAVVTNAAAHKNVANAPAEIPMGNTIPAAAKRPQAVVVVNPVCEHCAVFWPAIRSALSVMDSKGKALDLNVQLLPGDPGCVGKLDPDSATDDPGLADASCRATAHAFCASEQGRFSSFLDVFFTRIRSHKLQGLGLKVFSDVAEGAGLNMLDMQQCTGEVRGQAWRGTQVARGAATRLIVHLDAQRERYTNGESVPQLWVGGKRIFPSAEYTELPPQVTTQWVIGLLEKAYDLQAASE